MPTKPQLEASKPTGVERRIVSFATAPLKVEKRSGKPSRITGYAAVYDRLSEDLGGFREKIARGAFRQVITTADVRALVNHDPNLILGRNKSGTLKLAEDSTGLRVEINPPDSEIARHYTGSIERGDITGQSFGFVVGEGNDRWEKNADGTVIRTITGFRDLLDVGPVVYPAYPDTSVAARSLARFRGNSAGIAQPPTPGWLEDQSAFDMAVEETTEARLLMRAIQETKRTGHVPEWILGPPISEVGARCIRSEIEKGIPDTHEAKAVNRSLRQILDGQAKRAGSNACGTEFLLLRITLAELGF